MMIQSKRVTRMFVGVQLPRVVEVPGNNQNNPVRVQYYQSPNVSETFRVDYNDVGSTAAIVVPPLPRGHTFVVTSSLSKCIHPEGHFMACHPMTHMLILVKSSTCVRVVWEG